MEWKRDGDDEGSGREWKVTEYTKGVESEKESKGED
jgi:hypothetical protein